MLNPTTNQLEGPSGDGIGDDTEFFKRALLIYKVAGFSGYIVLEENKTYRITETVTILNQNGITIQGRGDNLSRSTIKIDFSGAQINDPGININKSYYVNLRKIRFVSTSAHIGDAVKVVRSAKAELHDLDFADVFNGVRAGVSNNVLLSKIKITNPRGKYGFYAFGLSPVVVNGELDRNDLDIIEFVDVVASSDNNDHLEWIRMGRYASSLHMFDVNITGGSKGVVFDYDPVQGPRYFTGTDVHIVGTLNEGIHLKSGNLLQLSKFSIKNAGGHGIKIEPEFTGGVLLSEPTITGSGKHGIYVGQGKQVHIFEPVIGHNSTSSLGGYSGIYLKNNTDEFSVNYGIVGQVDINEPNHQKYGIELEGVAGTDHNYFSIVNVQDVGNQITQTSTSDPNGNWFFIVQPTRVTSISVNSPINGVSNLIALEKEYPEDNEITLLAAGVDILQGVIDDLCPANINGILWLKPGRHRINNDININSCENLSIVGSSKNSLKNDLFLNQSNVKINVTNGSNNIVFKDVWFKSAKTHQATALNISNSKNITLVNSLFTNNGSAIDVYASTKTKIINTHTLAIKNKGIVISGDSQNQSLDTTVFRSNFSDQQDMGEGTGIGVTVNSYTDNTSLIETIGIAAGTSLLISGSVDENNELVHPTNIIAYANTSDHNSLEGILVKAGSGIEFTNNWISAHVNNNMTPYSGVQIENGKNIRFSNAYIRGFGGHGLHVINGEYIYLMNSVSGRHGKYSLSGNCEFDAIRIEASARKIYLSGGSANGSIYGDTWGYQARGLTLFSTDSILVKGFDFHDNCLSPPTHGNPTIEGFNPGWL